MTSPGTPLKAQARRIWRAGVAAADPGALLRDFLSLDGGAIVLGQRRIPVDEVETISIVGAGKAGARMAEAVVSLLKERPLAAKPVRGWVNVPVVPPRSRRTIRLYATRRGYENRPTRESLVGTRRIVSMLAAQGARDLTLCLVSGGGSALLSAPPTGITLRDKRRITSQLHASGASIEEVNAVRKHVSTVKGGGLLRAWHGRWLTSFILSDVVGDDVSVIASGPTAIDPTTFDDAIEVLRRYSLWDHAPRTVRRYLTEGRAGRRPETLKELPPGAENIVVGGNRQAREGAAREARRMGFEVLDLSDGYVGEAAEAGRRLAQVARDLRHRADAPARRMCLLAGGETTVRLGRAPGRGGRCQEAALAALAEPGRDLGDIVILIAGTDGEDGPTDAAGAVIDERTAHRARHRGLEPAAFLARHDAYTFFDRVGGLVRTGLTGTNVMDLAVILVSPRPRL
jgi:glycerate-2-kinase